MAGYNHLAGMSNNALAAHKQGKLTLSQITSKHLKDQVGFEYTLKFFKYLVKRGLILEDEYHHTGGTWYNDTNFYELESIKDQLRTIKIDEPTLLPELFKKFKEAEAEAEVEVEGTFAVFGNRIKGHCRIVGYENFTGILRGNWIHLSGGGRKKADSRHISFKKIQKTI